ncbi:hypothetical protein [Leucobacter sp. W1038]
MSTTTPWIAKSIENSLSGDPFIQPGRFIKLSMEIFLLARMHD